MTAVEQILTEGAVLELKRALEGSSNPSEFFGRADVLTKDRNHLLNLEAPYEFDDSLSAKRSGVSVDDSANIQTVFEGIGQIGRDRAADPRLWNYLSLVTFRSYMEERWAPSTSENWRRSFRSRWLLINPSRNALARHGISRLWWIAQLSYDRSQTDPYKYTKIMMDKEDRMTGLLERQIGSLSNVTRAVLDYAERSAKNGSEDRIRYVLRSLTGIYGYRDLARLPVSELDKVLQEIEANKPASVP